MPHRHPTSGRRAVRLPPLLSVAAVALLQTRLPDHFTVGPWWLLPGVEALLAIALTAFRFSTADREGRGARVVAVVLVGALGLSNAALLVAVVREVFGGGSTTAAGAQSLLVVALQVFVTNVLVFGLLYFELDRGGPVSRDTVDPGDQPAPDFSFPQDQQSPQGQQGPQDQGPQVAWTPSFVDYLYVSFTNSAAYSPTDTMPLTVRAKVLMMVQASAALLTAVIVLAKGINALS